MKKLNKKGFTLIELLAVIVVLAIILVIAVPKVIDVINNARKESLGKSAQLAAVQILQEYAVDSMNAAPTEVTDEDCPASIKFTEGTCTYTSTLVDNQMTFEVTLVGSGKFLGWTAVAEDGTAATVTATVTP